MQGALLMASAKPGVTYRWSEEEERRGGGRHAMRAEVIFCDAGEPGMDEAQLPQELQLLFAQG